MVDQSGYPGAIVSSQKKQSAANGECILFVDGLRYDLAQQLSELLIKRGYKVDGEVSWAALPSVTATGKPAVSPVREFIEGGEASSDFEPSVKETGKSLKGGYHLKFSVNRACGNASASVQNHFVDVNKMVETKRTSI